MWVLGGDGGQPLADVWVTDQKPSFSNTRDIAYCSLKIAPSNERLNLSARCTEDRDTGFCYYSYTSEELGKFSFLIPRLSLSVSPS